MHKPSIDRNVRSTRKPLFPATITWGLLAFSVTNVLLWFRLASALREYPWRLVIALCAICILAIYFVAELIRWRGQISLKMMISLVTLVAFVCSAWGGGTLRAYQQRRQVRAIQAAGGEVGYQGGIRYAMEGKTIAVNDWRVPDQVVAGDSWLLPEWIANLLGIDFPKRPFKARFNGAGTTDEQLADLDLTAFEYIDLSGTLISDTSLSHLAQYRQWRFLCLSGTSVTDAGMKHIAQFLELEYLDLSHTQITDIGLLELHPLQNLRRIDLAGTKLSRKDLRKLHEALRHCIITHDSVAYYFGPDGNVHVLSASKD